MVRESLHRRILGSVWGWAFCASLLLLSINGYWLVRYHSVDAPALPHGDGPDYESLAYSLYLGNGFEFCWQDPTWQAPYRSSALAEEYSQFDRRDWPGPTTSRPPALPWLISQVYRWVPRGPASFAVVRWMSVVALSIAGGLAVWLAGSLTKELVPGVLCTLVACAVAMGLAIADRTIKSYLRDFLTEPWALLGVMVFALSMLRWAKNPEKLRWLFVSGIVLGVLVLFRSLFIFWLPVILLALFVNTRALSLKKFYWCWAPGCFLLAVCLVAGPWWVRNCVVMERWMPMGGQGAASLRGGYSDEALADWGNWHADAEISMQSKLDQQDGAESWTAAQREVALAELASHETWSWILEHWQDLPRLGAMRLITHWGPWRIDHVAWKCAAIVGVLWVWRNDRRQGVVIASILLADAISTVLLYETGGRFLIPLHGLLYALAGVGLAGCLALVWKNPVHPGHEIVVPAGS